MSYTRLRYHLITTTKKRHPWITDEIEEVVHRTMVQRAEALGSKIVAIGGVEDHVHILGAIPPDASVSRTVGRLKAASSKKIHEVFSDHEHFEWQVGFGGFTISPGDVSRVAAYVRNQKARHQNDALWEVFEETG